LTVEITKAPKDEELSQGIARLVISFITIFFLFYLEVTNQHTTQLVLIIVSTYFIFACGWILLIKHRPGIYISRRIIAISADLSICSFTIYNLNEWGGVFYATFLWVILGNGMRFGQFYLKFALILGVIGFTIVLVFASFWQDKLPLGVGLLIAIIVLPLFYSTLITRLHTLNDKLSLELDRSKYAATHDGMTSLLNREYFVQRLQEEIYRSKRYGNTFCVFYIDVDNFKMINDTYGHLQGDTVIIEIANRLKETIRITDIAARMGGDEFAMIVLSMEKQNDIENFSQKLIDSISGSIKLDTTEIHPSASVGISVYPFCGETINDLVLAADTAMYLSKSSGKNTYSVSEKYLNRDK